MARLAVKTSPLANVRPSIIMLLRVRYKNINIKYFTVKSGKIKTRVTSNLRG